MSCVPEPPWAVVKPDPDHCDKAWIMGDEIHVSVHQRSSTDAPTYAICTVSGEEAWDAWVRTAGAERPSSPAVTDEQLERVRRDFRLSGYREVGEASEGVRWLSAHR